MSSKNPLNSSIGLSSTLKPIKENKLPNGKYCGLTPCFRDEKILDNLHQQYFMKVELINTINVNKNSLTEMINFAKNFFNNYLKTEVIQIDENSFDIFGNGIELGSYGIRKYNNTKYIYGTGCAEPRLSSAINLK